MGRLASFDLDSAQGYVLGDGPLRKCRFGAGEMVQWAEVLVTDPRTHPAEGDLALAL